MNKKSTLMSAVKSEQLLMDTYGVQLPLVTESSPTFPGPTDPTAKAILLLFSPVILQKYTPLSVEADGNCFYRAVSRALYGHENYHLLIRLHASLEIAGNRDLYDIESRHYVDVVNDYRIWCNEFIPLLTSTATPTSWAGFQNIIAVCNALGISLRSYCPSTIASDQSLALNRTVTGRGVRPNRPVNGIIMWSQVSVPASEDDFQPNHFVVLMEKAPQTPIKTFDLTSDTEFPTLKEPSKKPTSCLEKKYEMSKSPSSVKSVSSEVELKVYKMSAPFNIPIEGHLTVLDLDHFEDVCSSDIPVSVDLVKSSDIDLFGDDSSVEAVKIESSTNADSTMILQSSDTPLSVALDSHSPLSPLIYSTISDYFSPNSPIEITPPPSLSNYSSDLESNPVEITPPPSLLNYSSEYDELPSISSRSLSPADSIISSLSTGKDSVLSSPKYSPSKLDVQDVDPVLEHKSDSLADLNEQNMDSHISTTDSVDDVGYVDDAYAQGGKDLPGPGQKFLDINELLCVLKSDETIHPFIPRGIKEFKYFIVSNEDNMNRRANGKNCMYWDDCGQWDRKKSSGGTTNFILGSDSSLKKVVVRGGQYCIERTKMKKTIFIPVDPQPSSKNIIILQRKYIKHSLSVTYEKRISWIMNPTDYPKVIIECT